MYKIKSVLPKKKKTLRKKQSLPQDENEHLSEFNIIYKTLVLNNSTAW